MQAQKTFLFQNGDITTSIHYLLPKAHTKENKWPIFLYINQKNGTPTAKVLLRKCVYADAERYLWFYCAFPPSGIASCGRTLGLLDFSNQKSTHFPETQFQAASPFVELEKGDIY